MKTRWRRIRLAQQVKPQAHAQFHKPPRIVILGAGFAGLEVALRLANTALDVVLIDRQNHHTFQPMLHQVATAELEPSQIAYPIRWTLRRAPNVQFVLADVIDTQSTQSWVETSAGRFLYDILVVATGSKPRLSLVPGAEHYAFALKTVSDAVAIHHQVLRCFERALQTADPDQRQGCLTVAIAGGGTTGVELAGAMAEWIQHSLVKDYSQLNCQQIRLVLLHSGPALLPGFKPHLQRYALRHLQKLGVDVYLETRVREVSPTAVHLTDGTDIFTQTVIWTAGVEANLPSRDTGPRLPVLPTLQLESDPQVYALGDVAGDRQSPLPMLASVAAQQGRTVARNIQRQVRGQPLLPFKHQSIGAMAILSRHAAVVQIGCFSATGFVAWVLWLGVHVVLLRGLRHRFLTLLHWGLSYCFRERVSQVLWQPAPVEKPVSLIKQGR
ncbi:MAG: NAD(P)/FAD-dependent oxidoreductase [Kaiparowitsia implicata GSE-PSE-MK54-09C]|jgi:NADH dehydrogenase|nr:NAD(P)/FAD-dependent oxidoreductase [Kaiparowitsia implicata GSE-PSE-MK54-09C]